MPPLPQSKYPMPWLAPSTPLKRQEPTPTNQHNLTITLHTDYTVIHLHKTLKKYKTYIRTYVKLVRPYVI